MGGETLDKHEMDSTSIDARHENTLPTGRGGSIKSEDVVGKPKDNTSKMEDATQLDHKLMGVASKSDESARVTGELESVASKLASELGVTAKPVVTVASERVAVQSDGVGSVLQGMAAKPGVAVKPGVITGSAVRSDGVDSVLQGVTDKPDDPVLQGVTAKPITGSEPMAVRSDAVLQGVAAKSGVTAESAHVTVGSGGIATGLGGAVTRSEGVVTELNNMADVASTEQGVTAKLKGTATRLDGVAMSVGVASKAGGAASKAGGMASKAGGVAQDLTPEGKALLEAETGRPADATPERVLTPISRIMEMVQFGKKNLASTDARFLSKLQTDLKEICISLSDNPKEPEDHKGEQTCLILWSNPLLWKNLMTEVVQTLWL